MKMKHRNRESKSQKREKEEKNKKKKEKERIASKYCLSLSDEYEMTANGIYLIIVLIWAEI